MELQNKSDDSSSVRLPLYKEQIRANNYEHVVFVSPARCCCADVDEFFCEDMLQLKTSE